MDHYYIIGDPVEHSRSPEIHQQFARQSDIQLSYGRRRVIADAFRTDMMSLQSEGVKGLNVTSPLKELAFDYADQLTPRAQLAGSVNTIKFTDGLVLGDNTDGAGLVKDMLMRLNWQIADKSILILGAGGAARGIIGPLLDCVPRSLVLLNRTDSRARQLISDLDLSDSVSMYDGQQDFDIIINATSASLSGDLPILPNCQSLHKTYCYDLAYAVAEMPFMTWAGSLGCRQVVDGVGMVVEQAAESFRLWTGLVCDTSQVYAMIRETCA